MYNVLRRHATVLVDGPATGGSGNLFSFSFSLLWEVCGGVRSGHGTWRREVGWTWREGRSSELRVTSGSHM